MKVRCSYGRYLSSHIIADGDPHIVLRYTGMGVRRPEYDTVFFPNAEGDEIVAVDGDTFAAIGTMPAECIVDDPPTVGVGIPATA